jgi:hypothetical protein
MSYFDCFIKNVLPILMQQKVITIEIRKYNVRNVLDDILCDTIKLFNVIYS